MADIKPALLAAIIKKTGLKQAQVYVRIKQTASNKLLPRHLAAIRVGADVGLTINKYATPDELAQLRSAGSPVAPPITATVVATPGKVRSNTKRKAPTEIPNAVFVVHGRDNDARNAMFTFLRAVGVTPIEWTTALKMSKKAAPYISEILETAFARAIVVLMTPDDLARSAPISYYSRTSRMSGRQLGKRRPMSFSRQEWRSPRTRIER